MPYADDDFILISALQHYRYCPRQFALIHLERYWGENYLTRDGKHCHDRVDLPGAHRGCGRRVEYALPLSCRELGICGQADAVEFLKGGSVAPVEYKRGREKTEDCDRIQLCAQVFCLEEMMGMSIPAAWLFYFETRTRVEVEISEELRRECREAILGCRSLLTAGITPRAAYDGRRCRACSLLDYCLPPRDLRSFQKDFEESLR